ncbi:hypothetical protein KVK15_03585 [Helicobacter pylori]|nr:hypothetical protein KVK15_03585 [Helicobacter pylori]
MDKDYFVKHVGYSLKHYKKGVAIIDDLRFYNELTHLLSFAKRLYIVGIDSANTNNTDIAEVNYPTAKAIGLFLAS